MTDLVKTTWTHSDPTLNARASAGLDAMAGDGLGNTQAAVNQWLGVTALRGLLCGYLIGSVSAVTSQEGITTYQVAFDLSDTTQPLARRRVAAALLSPIRAYAALAYPDEQATQATDVGVIPIALIAGVAVQVAIVAGATVAITYAVHQASQIVNGIFNRKADAEILEKKDAAALTAVAQHVEAEQKAGKALPISAATQAVIDQASLATREVLAKRDPGVESGLAVANSWLPAWVPWLGGAAAGAALLVLILAAVRKVSSHG